MNKGFGTVHKSRKSAKKGKFPRTPFGVIVRAGRDFPKLIAEMAGKIEGDVRTHQSDEKKLEVLLQWFAAIRHEFTVFCKDDQLAESMAQQVLRRLSPDILLLAQDRDKVNAAVQRLNQNAST